MFRATKSMLALLVLAASLPVGGCDSGDRAGQTGTTATDTSGGAGGDAATPMAGDGSGAVADPHDTTASAAVDTTSPVGGTLQDLRGRLGSEARALDRAVTAGDYDAIAARALRVRDLIVALGGKSLTLPAGKNEEIEGLIGPGTQVVEKLRAHAAARETAGIKAQNTELQGTVARILKASA